MKPIFEALKRGERFPFPLLVSHYEDCADYWDWWWSQRSLDHLDRPFLISDDDPILTQSSSNLFVDTLTYYHLFDKFLITAIKEHRLPQESQFPRQKYQEALLDFMVVGRSVAQSPKTIVFVGGGYGAGKTTSVAFLTKANRISLPGTAIVGVDYFKPYLPEYEALRRMGDGRASSTVQGEARTLSDRLFSKLLEMGRSFVWDSSMSDAQATHKKIEAAKSRGYDLELIAVSSTVAGATARAMERAHQTRRFAHPDHLEESHHTFSAAFPSYVDHFQRVMLFWNDWIPGGSDADPLLIAEKSAMNELECYEEERLNRFLNLGRGQL